MLPAPAEEPQKCPISSRILSFSGFLLAGAGSEAWEEHLKCSLSLSCLPKCPLAQGSGSKNHNPQPKQLQRKQIQSNPPQNISLLRGAAVKGAKGALQIPEERPGFTRKSKTSKTPAVRSNLARAESTHLFLSSVKTTLMVPCQGKRELFYVSGRKPCCVIWDIIDALKRLTLGVQCDAELQVWSRFSQDFFLWLLEMLPTRIKPLSTEFSPAARHRRQNPTTAISTPRNEREREISTPCLLTVLDPLGFHKEKPPSPPAAGQAGHLQPS